MMRWRSAFLFSGLAVALGLSTALGCAIAPLDPEDEVVDDESGLVSGSLPEESDEPGADGTADPLEGDQQNPDPIPWMPDGLVNRDPQIPGVPVVAPDPIPWDTADSGRDSRKGTR